MPYKLQIRHTVLEDRPIRSNQVRILSIPEITRGCLFNLFILECFSHDSY